MPIDSKTAEHLRPIMRTIQGVIEAWDASEANPSRGSGDADASHRCCAFESAGDVQPLRDLIILYGNQKTPKPQGIIEQ